MNNNNLIRRFAIARPAKAEGRIYSLPRRSAVPAQALQISRAVRGQPLRMVWRVESATGRIVALWQLSDAEKITDLANERMRRMRGVLAMPLRHIFRRAA